jgi:serine/threonine protein kinase/WD40 repeat protein
MAMLPLSKQPTVVGENIRAWLAGAADLPPAEVVERIARDLERRWRNGERVPVETYLTAVQGAADDDVRMDLIYAEVVAREAAGDRPGPAEYIFRFPELAERIKHQFLLHRTLLEDPAPDEPEAAPTPPTRTFAHAVPGYEILEELGSGGMGVVYMARHLELGRTVALKVLRADSCGRDPELRLRREAEALARVSHPHIVQIYEVGVAADQPYLALEYVPGGTLADRLRAGPMKARDAAAAVRMVALAVHAAHEQGLVHRDLKPANILLPAPISTPESSEGASSRSGVIPEPAVKVTDFGLVKRLDQSDLSRTGELLGTPCYMAPEQAAGRKDIGAAVDVYALGAILYEALSGRPPFQGDSAISVLAQVAGAEPIPPSRLRRGVPRDLEAVVLKCLEKNPAHRYAGAAALAEDLRRFLAGEPTLARPLTAPGRIVKLVRRHPLTSALLALVAGSLLLGLAGILWQWREAVTARGSLQTALDAEAEQRRQAEHNLYRGRIAQVIFLWEGGQAAQARELLEYCRPRDGADDLRGWEWHYLDRLLHAEVRTLRLPGPVNALVLCPSRPDSPDELAVALGQSRLSRRDPGSEKVATGFIQPTDMSDFRIGPAFPADAEVVAAQPDGPLVAWGANNGKLVIGDRTTGQVLWSVHQREGIKGLCFTPEGTLLAGGAFNRIREWNARTGKAAAEHPIPGGVADALAIQPAGSLVAVGNATNAKLSIYERPTYRPVTDLVSEGTRLQAVAFSSDGNRLAAGYYSGHVSVWDTKSWQEVRRFQGGVGPVRALAFHPSGRQLAVGGGDRSVRLWDLTSGGSAAVYRGHEGEVLALVFGPRGDWLASGSRDQTVRIWDTAYDPRGRLLSFRPGKNGYAFDQPPDGLAVQAVSREGKRQAWMTADGRPLLRSELSLRDNNSVTPWRNSAMLIGGRVAIIFSENQRAVAIWEPGGSRPQRVLPAGEGKVQAVAADPGGRCLVWAAAAKDGVTIRRWDAAAEVEGEPTRLDVPSVRSLTVESPDGWVIAVAGGAKPDDDSVVWAIDPTGAQPPREVLRDAVPVGGVAFRPDGRELAVTVGDQIRLYRVGSWERVRQYPGLAPATGLAYSPDGRRLAVVSDDGVVTLSDPAVGRSLFQLHSLGRPRVNDVSQNADVAFSPDGAWLISTNWDGTFNLWDGLPLHGR